MADLYSAESVEEIVPAIMRLQALVVSPGIEALPAKGGWRHIPRSGTPTAPCMAQPEAQPIATAQPARAAPPPSAKRMRQPTR